MHSKTSILIIGNGFDKQCGLSSSFDDFYYASTEWNTIRNNTHIFGPDFYEISCWFSLFQEMIYKKIKHNNWCNVEQHMENILIDYDNVISEKLRKDIDVFVEKTPYESSKVSLMKFLFNGLNKFEKCFSEYLVNNIDNKNSDAKINDKDNKYSYKVRKLIEKIKNSTHIDRKLYVLNFNYTQIKEFIMGNSVSEIQGSIHVEDNSYFWNEGYVKENNVHGTLKNKIIIGIDDKRCSSDYLKCFSKTYRKMKTLADDHLNELPNEIDKIVFYGHSLGRQDYSYFYSIFDFYKIYNSSIKLIFCYVKSYEEETFDNVYRLIHEYGKDFDNINQGHNLLHKIILEGRLKIIEI